MFVRCNPTSDTSVGGYLRRCRTNAVRASVHSAGSRRNRDVAEAEVWVRYQKLSARSQSDCGCE
jgi:hypothetical protein